MEEENKILLTNFLKMIKNRNIELNEEYKINLKKITDEYVYKFFSKSLNLIDKEEKIYVSFIEKKIGIKELKTRILDNLKDKKYEELIIITKIKLNSHIMNKLNNINKDIQIFMYNNFYINLIDNYLVPKHQILNKKYEKIIKEKFNNKLPLIKKKDPICRYYNCKIGQVLKIYRKNEIYYRMVSN